MTSKERNARIDELHNLTDYMGQSGRSLPVWLHRYKEDRVDELNNAGEVHFTGGDKDHITARLDELEDSIRSLKARLEVDKSRATLDEKLDAILSDHDHKVTGRYGSRSDTVKEIKKLLVDK